MNLRDSILDKNDLPREAVAIPEWGETVHVRTMSARERDAFETDHAKVGAANLRARLAVFTVCHEAGELVFDAADADALGAKSCAALDRIAQVALKLNKITSSDVDALEKN